MHDPEGELPKEFRARSRQRLHLFSQFRWGQSGMGLDDPAEIIDILKSGSVGDFPDGEAGLFKEGYGVLDSELSDVFRGCHIHFLPEDAEEG